MSYAHDDNSSQITSHSRLESADVGKDGPGLRELLTLLFKRRSTIVYTFVAVVTAVTVGTLISPPTYQADAKLLVKFGRENIYRPEVGADRSEVRTSSNEEILNSEANILTSRDLLARVVSSLTVERMYPSLIRSRPRRGTPLDAAVERFAKDLVVEGLKKSSVLQISLQHKDPWVAATAVNMLVDYFKEKHLQAYSDPKSVYLERQLVDHDVRLKQSQIQLEAFKQKNRVFSLDEQRSLLLRQRTELDTVFKETQNQIREIKEHISSLQRQVQTVSRDVPLSTETERYRSVDDANAQLLSLQLKEQELLRIFTEDNKQVVSVQREIQIVQAFISQQKEEIKGRIRTGQNVVFQELEKELLKFQAELPSQEAKSASLRNQIAQLDADIPKLDLTEMELENLKRDMSVNDKNYRTYQDKMEDALILEDLNRQKSANISVIQEAAIPVRPVKPNKAVNLLLGVILGSLAGLGFALVRELLTEAMSTPESAERRLRLPVLVTISMKG